MLHAKVYILGQTYLVESLQQHCLHKLYRDLTKIDLRSSGWTILNLIRFVYENTSANDELGAGAGAELRYLVSAYAFCMEEELLRFKFFRDFLDSAESAEFQRDITFQRFSKHETERKEAKVANPWFDED